MQRAADQRLPLVDWMQRSVRRHSDVRQLGRAVSTDSPAPQARGLQVEPSWDHADDKAAADAATRRALVAIGAAVVNAGVEITIEPEHFGMQLMPIEILVD